MVQFQRCSIFMLVLSYCMFSCQEENNFKWENAVIRSENDAILISSFNIVSLIKKSNPSENEQLNFSQKMMLRAATSSLASSSTGFRTEGQHHMFVVPKGGEINGGVFYPGEIINIRKFASTVQDVFGDNTNVENQVNYIYNKNYNVMLGFDSDHFIMGSSYDSAFLKQKISSYFTVNQSEMEDPFLEEFLSFDGDLSFYFDGEKTLDHILSVPHLKYPNILSEADLFEKGFPYKSLYEYHSRWYEVETTEPTNDVWFKRAKLVKVYFPIFLSAPSPKKHVQDSLNKYSKRVIEIVLPTYLDLFASKNVRVNMVSPGPVKNIQKKNI